MVNISLSDELLAAIEAGVRENGFASPPEYIAWLVRQDQKRRAKEQIGAMLLGNNDSGEPVEMTAEAWQNLRLSRNVER